MVMRRSGFIPKLPQPKSRSPGPPVKSATKGRVRGTRSMPEQDFFEGCFEDFQRMQTSERPQGKTHLEVFTETFCNNCRNTECVRAGNKTLAWAKRMREQPEWLLNNPIFSELATLDHQRIHDLPFAQRKHEQEKLLADWNPGSRAEQSLQSSWASSPPGSPESVTVGEVLSEASPKEEGTEPQVVLAPISAKGPAPSPSVFQGELPKLPNVSTPPGGILLPGAVPSGQAPGSGSDSGGSSTPARVHDVWSSSAPKVVQPGAVIRMGPSRK